MSLQNINPTKTNAWKELTEHFKNIKDLQIKDLFTSDKSRKENFSIDFDDLTVDFSKNRITQKTIDLLVDLANQTELKDAINKQFSGEKINETEDRAVLHTALRSDLENPVLVDGKNINPQIKKALSKIDKFSKKVISGKWKGYTDKPITDIVNIGIGGSDLGPDMIVEALQFYKNH